ncbi:MAG: PAS domain S-box protein [Gammaproteobacteria bacterium]|nr:PAS domain S-box protein [Gammaproteobacteria bacterium]
MSAEDKLVAELNNDYLVNKVANKHFIQSIVKHTPAVLIATNDRGLVTFVEGNTRDMFGIEPPDFFERSLESIHDAFSTLGQYITQALLGDEVTTSLNVDGSVIRVWLTPVRRQNKVENVTLTCLDISINYELEKALKEVQRHYLLLAEHSTDLITKYTPDGICRYASPATSKVLGYRPDELIGKVVFELFHPSDQKSKRRIASKLLSDSGSDAISYRVQHRDDHYIWLETRTTAINDPETGEIVEIVAVSRDITERKESEERLLIWPTMIP